MLFSSSFWSATSGGQPTRKDRLPRRQNREPFFQAAGGDVQQRPGFDVSPSRRAISVAVPGPAGQVNGLGAERLGFALAFRRDGDDKFRAFAHEQRQFPDGVAMAGVNKLGFAGRIRVFIHRLGGFEQQGVDGFRDGAFAVGFGRQVFKGAGFPRQNSPEGDLAARALGLGVESIRRFANHSFPRAGRA